MATVSEVFVAFETASGYSRQAPKEGSNHGKFLVARSCLRELLVLCQIELEMTPRDEEFIAELKSLRDSMPQ